MAETYMLDACDLIAFLKKETGGEIINAKFESVLAGQCLIYLHKATLAETVYDLLRSGVFADAKTIFSVCRSLPVEKSGEVSFEWIR